MRSDRSQGLPLRVFPLRRLPALSLLPGHIPAQDARWLALGKRAMSVPISATSASATYRPTPGIVSRRPIAGSSSRTRSATSVLTLGDLGAHAGDRLVEE